MKASIPIIGLIITALSLVTAGIIAHNKELEEQKLKDLIVAKLVSNEMDKDTCESLIPLLLEGDQSKVRALLKPWLDKQNWKVNNEIFDFVERCYNGDCKFSSVWEIASTLGVQ